MQESSGDPDRPRTLGALCRVRGRAHRISRVADRGYEPGRDSGLELQGRGNDGCRAGPGKRSDDRSDGARPRDVVFGLVPDGGEFREGGRARHGESPRGARAGGGGTHVFFTAGTTRL